MTAISGCFTGLPAKPTVLSPEHSPRPFSTLLSGEHAFYKAADYEQSTKRALQATIRMPVTYTWNTESKIVRIVKRILSILIFPIGIYQLLHALAGKGPLLPASTPFLVGQSKRKLNKLRSNIELGGEWKYKRITVEVDGYKIDALIVGKASTLGNGKWVLASNGNGEFYENKLSPFHEFRQILSKIDGNAIIFNYPGVGASSGLPNRYAMAKAYQAMLRFLEDKKRGIGAKEIIGYGHSIGGGVQGDALNTHLLRKDIKYVFVKSKTFSDLTDAASTLTNKLLGFLVKLLGWNIDSVASSKKLQAPEIVIQTASVKGYEELTDSSKIVHDGIITAEASLAKALLDDNECPRHKKIFIGVQGDHNSPLINPAYLADKISFALKTI